MLLNHKKSVGDGNKVNHGKDSYAIEVGCEDSDAEEKITADMVVFFKNLPIIASSPISSVLDYSLQP